MVSAVTDAMGGQHRWCHQSDWGTPKPSALLCQSPAVTGQPGLLCLSRAVPSGTLRGCWQEKPASRAVPIAGVHPSQVCDYGRRAVLMTPRCDWHKSCPLHRLVGCIWEWWGSGRAHSRGTSSAAQGDLPLVIPDASGQARTRGHSHSRSAKWASGWDRCVAVFTLRWQAAAPQGVRGRQGRRGEG